MFSKRYFTFLLVILAPFVLIACFGGNDAEEQLAEEQAAEATSMAEGLRQAADELDKAAGNSNGGTAREPIDFRELKEMLPSAMLGMERTKHEGQKIGVAGFRMSTAEAEYRDGDKRITVTLADGAAIQIAAMTAAWSMVEIDSEEGTKVTRTVNIDGHKAFYEYDSGTRRGQLSILAGQTLVTIEGRDVDGDELEEVYNDLDL